MVDGEGAALRDDVDPVRAAPRPEGRNERGGGEAPADHEDAVRGPVVGRLAAGGGKARGHDANATLGTVIFPTWRKPTVIAVCLLVLAVAAIAILVDSRSAAWLLAAGLAIAAALRWFAPERDVLDARGRRFDVTVMLILAVAIAVLAPWGNAVVQG